MIANGSACCSTFEMIPIYPLLFPLKHQSRCQTESKILQCVACKDCLKFFVSALCVHDSYGMFTKRNRVYCVVRVK